VGREAASIIRMIFFYVLLFLFLGLEVEVAKSALEFDRV
jgi:hypothetical protein